MRVIVHEHKTRYIIPNIIIPEMCLGNGSLPSKPDPCDRALTGVGSHTMNRGGKGQGNVTYPDSHIAVLYQTPPHAIKPWGH